MKWRSGPEREALAEAAVVSASASCSGRGSPTLQYLHDCDPRDCNIVNHSVRRRHLSDVMCTHADVKNGSVLCLLSRLKRKTRQRHFVDVVARSSHFIESMTERFWFGLETNSVAANIRRSRNLTARILNQFSTKEWCCDEVLNSAYCWYVSRFDGSLFHRLCGRSAIQRRLQHCSESWIVWFADASAMVRGSSDGNEWWIKQLWLSPDRI